MTPRQAAVWAALTALALASGPRGAAAQARAVPQPPPSVPAADTRITAPVTAEAVTGDVRIVRVAVPDAFDGRTVRFAVEVHEAAIRLISRPRGELVAGEGRATLLGFAVPPAARAGPADVATVVWSAGSDSLFTPIRLTVLPATALRVTLRQELVAVRSGGTVRVAALVANVGNATTAVRIQATVPTGWRGRAVGSEVLELRPGESREVTVEIRATEVTSEGDYPVVIRAIADGTSAEVALQVRVTDGAFGDARGLPRVVLSAAYATPDVGRGATAVGAEIAGTVAPGVYATGLLNAFNGDAVGPSARSLGRLGYAPGASFISLVADRWSADAGLVAAVRPSLAGMAYSGQGAAGRFQGESWRVGGLAARPFDAPLGGIFATAEGARRVGPGWAGIAASRLDDGRRDGREVTTAIGSYDLPWSRGGLTLEAGYRDGGFARGLGWLARAERRGADWAAGLTAAHAPGGSRAFARAEDELQADIFRRFGPVALGATAWRLGDRGAAGVETENLGWSVTPSLALGAFGSLTFELRAFDFEQEAPVGAIGTGERLASVTYGTSWRSLSGFVTAGQGRVTRTTTLSEELAVASSAPRTLLNGSVSWMTSAGRISVTGGREQVGPGVGIPSEQVSYGVHADDVPLWPAWVWLRADATRAVLPATGVQLRSYVAGLTVRMTSDLRLLLDAERSDFIRTPEGQVPWLYAVRVERGVRLRNVPGGTARAVVFEDRNGNGRRDADERGIPGVLVRVGGRPVQTDERGRFPVVGGDNVPVTVDLRSLPAGLVVAPAAPRRGARDVAVIPTRPVTVRLVVDARDIVEPARVQLARVIVTLRDAGGRLWTAVPDSAGVTRFDALPPGEYTAGADASQLGEPVVIDAAPPVVRVSGGAEPLEVVLTVRGRPVRQLEPRTPRRISSSGGSGESQ